MRPLPLKVMSCQGMNRVCTSWRKRHGRSSGMRHGWRSASSRFEPRFCPSVQGPVGEVPATAPFSITLHRWYRRWMGGVSRPRSFFLCPVRNIITQSKKQGTGHNTPAAVPPVTGTAGRREPHLLLVFPLGDSNCRLWGSSRLYSRCSARLQNCHTCSRISAIQSHGPYI